MPHQKSSISQPLASQQLKLIVHVGFALTGVVTTLIGVLLPILAQRWNLDDAQSGYLLAAQNIGGLSSTIFVGQFIRRLGMKQSLVLSFILMATGLAGLSTRMFVIGLAAVFCGGLGLGIAIPATNILIAEINGERRAAALNVLNFIWCIGAVVGTPLVGFLVERVNLYAPLAGLSLVLILIALLLAQTKSRPANAEQPTGHKSMPEEISSLQSRFVVLICVFAFLLVGIENALSGWIASYVTRLEDSQYSVASFYQAAFWASMLLGRATAPGVLNRLSEIRLVLSGIAIAAVGILLILASLNLVVILLGVCLAGLGLSSVFPTTIAIFSQILGAQAARKSSWLFTSGSLGSSTLPFLVGYVSSQVVSLRIGLMVPLIAALLAVGLQINLGRLIKRLTPVIK